MSDIFKSLKSAFTSDNQLTEYRNEDTDNGTVGGKLLLTAAVVGAGLYGLGRSGALRYMSKESHLIGKSLSETASVLNNEAPMLSMLLDNEPRDLFNKARGAFKSSLAANRSSVGELFNGKTYAETYAARAMQETSGFEYMLKKNAVNSGIVNQFSNDVKDQDLLKQISHFVGSKYNSKIKTAAELSEDLQKEFNISHELSEKVSLFSEQMAKNAAINPVVVNADKNKLRKIAIDEMQYKVGTIDDKGSSLLTGYKRATIDDLLKAGAEDRVKIGEKQKEFLQEVLDTATNADGEKIGHKILADKHVYKDADGKLIDLRTFPDAIRKFGEDISDTMPAKVFHVRDLLNGKDTRLMNFYGIGTSAPNISHLVNEKSSIFLDKAVMHIGTHLYDANSLEKLGNHSYRLLSAQYGTIARGTKTMFGMSTERPRKKMFGLVDPNSDSFMGKIYKNLDIGAQEEASGMEGVKGLFSKVKNPDWDRHVINRAVNGKADKEDYDNMSSFLAQHVNPLSKRTWSKTISSIDEANGISGKYDLNKLSMRNNDEIETAIDYFSTATNSNKVKNERLTWILKQYQSDPNGFLNRSISMSNKIPIDWLKSTSKITGHEIAKREIQKEVMLSNKGIDFPKYFASLKDKGHITSAEQKSASHLNMFSKFDELYFNTKTIDREKRTETIKALNEMFVNSPQDAGAANQLKNQYANVWQSIAFDGKGKSKINTDFMSLRDDSKLLFGLSKHKATDALKTLRGINDATTAKAAGNKVLSHTFDVYKELTAGRKRPEDVTSATMSGYFFLERLNKHMSAAGIGLSDRSLGSTAEIMSALMLKRVLPVTFGLGLANYADYRTEAYTGEGLYARGADAWINVHVGMQKMADKSGAASLYKKLYSLVPQLQYLDEKGPMNAEEKKDWYENGYSAVRRGRFWTLSPTPWSGDTVEYYKPNTARLIKSNYKYTDSLYGSKSEYWANSWMPTPAHPFAPIKHFITDRYHWEDKHQLDRPYPESAPLFASGTPLGALLNPTIGKMIKPIKKYHSSEVGLATDGSIIGGLNRLIHSKASQREKEKTLTPHTYSMAVSDGIAGLIPYKFLPDSMADPGSIIMKYKYGRNTEGDGKGFSVSADIEGSAIGALGGNSPVMLNAGRAGSNIQMLPGTGGSFSPDLTAINKKTQSKAAWLPQKDLSVQSRANGEAAVAPPIPVVSGTMLSPSVYKSKSINALDKADLSDLMQQGSLKSGIGDLTFSAKEITGIWGFFYDTATDGGAPKSKKLANAGSMTSYRRSFWDENLGGIGGALSEIGRRFVPRFGKEAGDFNPIRNTMPTWLPAKDRIGDPYTKYKKGEARLPGRGYEALNTLHSDVYGRYGAFDRFKILADIAPYSNEYKTWKHVTEQTVTDEDTKAEIKQIKRRVSTQKDQHRFFSYKFKHSQVESTNVTISEIIDKNTFTSRELPGTPIKMAGISFTAKGKDINTVLQAGQVVNIEFAKDPLRKSNKDTYRTLNTVVYLNGTNLNKQALESGLADERRDDSPAGIHAKFSKEAIGVGKFFETLGHNDTIPGLSLFNSKFTRIRSPLEEYERTEIWGKPYGTWQHPFKSYLFPTLERAWSKGMIGGAIKAGTVGAMIGVVTLNGLKSRTKAMAITGAVIGAVGGLKTTLARIVGGEYIPERVKKRREIEEYFDNVKYIKYRRLYDRARKLAWKHEKVNIELESKKIQQSTTESKTLKKKLQSFKQKLHMYGNNGGADQEGINDKRGYINDKINEATPQKTAKKIGNFTMAALMYKQEMESTMMGIPDTAPWITQVAALSRRERPYFAEFVGAPKAERKRILKLVPKKEAEMLKKVWGEDRGIGASILKFFRANGDKEVNWFVSKVVDIVKGSTVDVKALNEKIQKNIELEKYFLDHAKPSQDWGGWSPDVNLEQVKVKVLNHEGIDIADAGYMANDLKEAKHTAPPAFDIYKHSHFITSHINDLLGDSGLSDVTVVAIPTQQSGFNIKMDMLQSNTRNVSNMIQNMLV